MVMKMISVKSKVNPAFKRVQPLPSVAVMAAPYDEAWFGVACRNGEELIPGGMFPRRETDERMGRASAPGEVSGTSCALVMTACVGSGRLFV